MSNGRREMPRPGLTMRADAPLYTHLRVAVHIVNLLHGVVRHASREIPGYRYSTLPS